MEWHHSDSLHGECLALKKRTLLLPFHLFNSFVVHLGFFPFKFSKDLKDLMMQWVKTRKHVSVYIQQLETDKASRAQEGRGKKEIQLNDLWGWWWWAIELEKVRRALTLSLCAQWFIINNYHSFFSFYFKEEGKGPRGEWGNGSLIASADLMIREKLIYFVASWSLAISWFIPLLGVCGCEHYAVQHLLVM